MAEHLGTRTVLDRPERGRGGAAEGIVEAAARGPRLRSAGLRGRRRRRACPRRRAGAGEPSLRRGDGRGGAAARSDRLERVLAVLGPGCDGELSAEPRCSSESPALGAGRSLARHLGRHTRDRRRARRGGGSACRPRRASGGPVRARRGRRDPDPRWAAKRPARPRRRADLLLRPGRRRSRRAPAGRRGRRHASVEEAAPRWPSSASTPSSTTSVLGRERLLASAGEPAHAAPSSGYIRRAVEETGGGSPRPDGRRAFARRLAFCAQHPATTATSAAPSVTPAGRGVN